MSETRDRSVGIQLFNIYNTLPLHLFFVEVTIIMLSVHSWRACWKLIFNNCVRAYHKYIVPVYKNGTTDFHLCIILLKCCKFTHSTIQHEISDTMSIINFHQYFSFSRINFSITYLQLLNSIHGHTLYQKEQSQRMDLVLMEDMKSI